MIQVVQRSEHALEVLYARHSPLLRSVAMRILSNYAEVDDVLQDVFIHLWGRSEDYSAEKGQLLGWLVTITRRRALDRVRQRSAYQNATNRYEEKCKHAIGQPTSACIVDKEVQQHELHELVMHSIEGLPPQQGEVVQLTFFKGLSQREIAARLSLPLGTVKTRIELGMRKLSRSLAVQKAA
jgi:RNA polymerase sigma-70 factor (ECF subfamily)